MRIALALLETGRNDELSLTVAVDAHRVAKALKEHLARAQIVPVAPKQKVTSGQARARRKADGFKIKGEIYVKPNQFKRWIPTQPERNALKAHNIIIAEREDTATVERKIGGIQGKPRYYAIDVGALHRVASR